jgi:hypothetical protein
MGKGTGGEMRGGGREANAEGRGGGEGGAGEKEAREGWRDPRGRRDGRGAQECAMMEGGGSRQRAADSSPFPSGTASSRRQDPFSPRALKIKALAPLRPSRTARGQARKG